MIRGWRAAVGGVLGGAAAGGVILGAESALYMRMIGSYDGMTMWPVLSIVFAQFVGATLLFLAGLLIIGAPAWAVMHGRGARSRNNAVVAGIGLAVLTALLLSLTGGALGLFIGLFLAVGLIVPGAAAGWVLHRVAYGRAEV